MTTQITYLDPSRVTAKRQTDAPRHRSATGYGSKIPSTWQLMLDDKRWRRVYVVCWSNSGSAYVLVGGDRLFLGEYNPADSDSEPEDMAHADRIAANHGCGISPTAIGTPCISVLPFYTRGRPVDDNRIAKCRAALIAAGIRAEGWLS